MASTHETITVPMPVAPCPECIKSSDRGVSAGRYRAIYCRHYRAGSALIVEDGRIIGTWRTFNPISQEAFIHAIVDALEVDEKRGEVPKIIELPVPTAPCPECIRKNREIAMDKYRIVYCAHHEAGSVLIVEHGRIIGPWLTYSPITRDEFFKAITGSLGNNGGRPAVFSA